METQHRKITYRMKNRGMYWTLTGVEALSQMILLADKNELEDLFFGDWQEAYHPIKRLRASKEHPAKGLFVLYFLFNFS